MATQTGTATSLNVYVQSASAQTLDLGLYDSNGHLLAQASVGAVTSGLYSTSIAPTSIVSGNTYYLVWQASSSIAIVDNGAHFQDKFTANTFGSLPATIPITGGSTGNAGVPSIWAAGSVGGGIVSSSPFSVSGTPTNGGVLTIARSSGSFAAKAFGTGSPWLFDTVAHQYLNGVDQNLYAGFADGTDIAHLLYNAQSKDSSSGTDVTRYYTSRPRRTSFDVAGYASVNMAHGKGFVGMAHWPSAFGTQTNQRLYVSIWTKTKNAYSDLGGTGGGDLSTKWLRIENPSNSNTANDIVAVGAQNYFSASTQTQPSFNKNMEHSGGYPGVWTRQEIWLDLTLGGGTSTAGQLINWWFNGAWQNFSYSGMNTGGADNSFEACHPADVLYALNSPTNSWWDPSAYGATYPGITAFLLGFDDGHGQSTGNDFDIAQVYMDPNLERFEISDSATWDVSPTSTMNRELQGQWARNSATQCTITISQGQFAALSGKHLWYVSGRNTAQHVCSFT